MSVQIQVRSDSSQAQADLKKLEGSLKAVQSSTESINRSIVSFSNIAKTAFAAIPLAIVGNNAVKTAASFEVLEQRLLTVTKSSIATAAAMGAVAKIVAKTPFSIRSLTDAYARLATTGNSLFKSQSQIERGIKNIADAVAAVGGSDQELFRVAVAFERMSSEGRITAERLNQITDAGIPLTKIADQLGISMAELRDQSEKGTLTFNKFYKAFQQISESSDGFLGAAERQVNTLNGAMRNLNDAFDLLYDRLINGSGIGRILIAVINSTEKAIRSFTVGLDSQLAKGIGKIGFFYGYTALYIGKVGKVFTDTANKLRDFVLPDLEFNISLTDIKLELSKWMPNLERIKTSFSNFGKFIKDVFYSIWDEVVGNSTWPDLINGVLAWADKLVTLIKSPMKLFKDLVNNTFKNLNADQIKEKILSSVRELIKNVKLGIIEFNKFKVTVIAAVSAIGVAFDPLLSKLSAVANYIKDFTSNLYLQFKLNLSYEQLDYKDLFRIDKAEAAWGKVWKAFRLAAIPSISDLQEDLGALYDVVKNKFVNMIDRALLAPEAVSGFFANITSSMKGFVTSTFENAKQLFRNVTEGITTRFSDSISSIKLDVRNFLNDNDLRDFVASALLFAFNSTFRNLAIITIGTKFLIESFDISQVRAATDEIAKYFGSLLKRVIDNFAKEGPSTVSKALGEIYDLIVSFGNNLLKEAGFAGTGNLTGLLSGLFFGTLTVALLTGKLGALSKAVMGSITSLVKFVAQEALGGYFVKYFIGDDAKNEENIKKGETTGKTAGRRVGRAFKGALSIASAGIGIAIALAFTDDIVKNIGIEDPMLKLFAELGITTGIIFGTNLVAGMLGTKLLSSATWVASAFSLPVIKAALTRLALSTALLGALFPSVSAITGAVATMLAALAGALSLPVILAALGVAAGGFLIYNVFFGEEGGWGQKIKKLFQEQIGPAIESFFTGIFDWMSSKIEELGKTIKGIFSINSFKGKNSDSAGGNFTVDPISGLATGGKVSGKGTGTSDSILARLSNGEYVVNAKATSQNRGLLERINNGLPAFATGGYVSKDGNVISKAFPEDTILSSLVKQLNWSSPLSYIGLRATIDKESAGGLAQDEAPNPNALIKNKYKSRLESRGKWDKLFGGPFKNFTWDEIKHFANTQTVESLFNFAYADVNRSERYKLGNTGVGDGYRFRGRGWLQTTGRDNYKKAGFENDPEALASSSDNNTKAVTTLVRRIKGLDNLKDINSIAKVINRRINPGGKDTGIIIDKAQPYLSKLDSYYRSIASPFANGGYVNDEDFNMVGSYVRGFMGNVDDDYINNLLKQYKQTGQLEGHINTIRSMTKGYANGGYVNDEDFNMVSKYIRSFMGNIDDDYINQLLSQYKGTGQLNGHLELMRQITSGKGIPRYEAGGSVGFEAPEKPENNSELNKLITADLNKLINQRTPDQLLQLRQQAIAEKLKTESLFAIDSFTSQYGVSGKEALSVAGGAAALATGNLSYSTDLLGGDFKASLKKGKRLDFSFIKQFANGGSIMGPGTGTSDSILARLSNGEFVVNAKATADNRALLDRINSGLPAFAQGTPPLQNPLPFDYKKGGIQKVNNIDLDTKFLIDALNKSIDANLSTEEGLTLLTKAFKDAAYDAQDRGAISRFVPRSMINSKIDSFVSQPETKEKFVQSQSYIKSIREQDIAQFKKAVDSLSNKAAPAAPQQSTVEIIKAINVASTKQSALQELTNKLSSLGIDTSKYNLEKLSKDSEILNRTTTNVDNLLKTGNDLNRSLKDGVTEGIGLQEIAVASLKDILLKQLSIDLQIQTVDQLKAIRNEARANFTKKTGDAAAANVRGDFNTGLSSLLKGQSNIGDFGDTLLNSITGNIVDSFSAGITEGIFGKEGLKLESMFSGLFGEQAGIGFDLFGGSQVKTIGAGPTGSFGDPLYTKQDTSRKLNDKGEDGKGPIDTAKSTLNDAFDSFGASLDGTFASVTANLSQTFDGLKEVFKGLPNLLSGLFSGGGGGLGGLFSGIGSLFTMGSSPASMLASGMIPMDTGGVVPGQLSGQPFPILAHAGEIILNEAQQARVAASISGSNKQPNSVTLNITGDISRQTKAEIIKLMPQISSGVNAQNRENNRRR